MEEKIRVVVYGSLRKGDVLNGAFHDSKFLGQTTISGAIFDLGWYPAYVPEVEGTTIAEVYEVTPKVLQRLDALEGYSPRGGGYYDRKKIETEYGDAYVYTMQPNRVKGRVKVEGGDWIKHMKEKTWPIRKKVK